MAKTAASKMIPAGSLADLQVDGCRVVHSGDRPIAVFAVDGEVFAVDNRCPHMGFPLQRGTVKDGLLTCHWHQARFDLASGCTFDLWADDVPAYDVRVEDGQVFVSSVPRDRPDAPWYRRRLQRGMQQAIGLIQGKSLIGLLKLDVPVADVVREVADFGQANHDQWQSGMTLLTIVANLSRFLDERNTYYALYRATRQVASDCADAAPRRPREPLGQGRHNLTTLKNWLRHWTLARHRDGAERVVLTAVANGATPQQLTDLLCSAVNDRIFASTGHVFDFVNKAMELLDVIGHEHAADVLPLVIRGLVNARGAEEDAHWRHPVDIITPVREAEAELPSLLDDGAKAGDWTGGDALTDIILGEDPLAIIDALKAALAGGATPADLARHIAYAAAMRLARFATTNDVGDWFGPQHTFTYANAVHHAVTRSPTPGVARAIFHAALAVYQDRFLNVPPARLPGERDALDGLPAEAQALRDGLLAQLDQRGEPEGAARLVARYEQLERPIEALIETLTFATDREDVDFHPMQVLEAGVRQYFAWPAGSDQREHILVAVTRQLAAFCPTRRGNLQTATIAMRLHRGDRIYEDEG